MGRMTWIDPFMPTPLKDRINVLVTRNDKTEFPGADQYIAKDINDNIINLPNIYKNKDMYIIGGSEIVKQTFELVEEFYLTRIYGDFNCDKKIDLKRIQESMQIYKKIQEDENCHFEIWKK